MSAELLLLQITHFRGVRVTAELPVWNPSFDVTPCSLIEGIITEKGMAPRFDSHSAFQLPTWVNGALESPTKHTSTDETSDVGAIIDNFKELSSTEAINYVVSRPHLSIHVGDRDTREYWSVREIGDGNLNFVFIVEGPAGALCIKQAPPFVRIVGSSWPLSQNRSQIEADALSEEGRHCAAHVPAVLHFDEDEHVLVMQYIAPPHITLRKGLNEGNIYEKLGEHLVLFLSKTLFKTSYLSKRTDEFRALCSKFANKELCKLTEQVIFTDPYYPAKNNRHTSHPELDEEVKSLQSDITLRAEATKMKAVFLEKCQALIHGDLHTGSLMACEDSTYIIDPEFAFVGPMGFDIGKILGNFLLAYFAADGLSENDGICRARQKSWLLLLIQTVWNGFKSEFINLWNNDPCSGVCDPSLFSGAESKHSINILQDSFFSDLWKDVLGFAGCVMIRRVVGIAHVSDLENIQNLSTRAMCEKRCLNFGRRLLVEGDATFGDIESVVSAANLG